MYFSLGQFPVFHRRALIQYFVSLAIIDSCGRHVVQSLTVSIVIVMFYQLGDGLLQLLWVVIMFQLNQVCDVSHHEGKLAYTSTSRVLCKPIVPQETHCWRSYQLCLGDPLVSSWWPWPSCFVYSFSFTNISKLTIISFKSLNSFCVEVSKLCCERRRWIKPCSHWVALVLGSLLYDDESSFF